ncbi:MAG: nucleoside kinase [Clostridia bacterium]|nr:nucleoside kinase [Clostridia bacterium]
MINVIFDGKQMTIPVGTRVLDLLPEDQRTNYLMCKVGLVVKEMNYRLQERHDGVEIKLLGLEHIESGKAYEATLRYVIAMAFHHIYPEVDLRFSYNVSRAIYCESLTHGFNMSRATSAIIDEVQRIVQANLPIERVTLSLEEGREVYKRFNHHDKLAILQYRPEDYVHLYKCGDYFDYLHNYMLPSTGCLKNYLIRPYSPGLIIQYPRYELDGKIPHFTEETTYGRTLQKAYRWSKNVGLQTVPQLNLQVLGGNVLELVQMCEARHNQMLTELGDAIQNDIENIRLIGIAGPSSSGKTTFCNRLRVELLSRGIRPVTISMDDYYLAKTEIAKIQGKPIGQLDLEHINCLDIAQFNKDLFDLINGEEVTLPRFNFKTGLREEGKRIKVDYNSPIIIEGIHALNEKLTSSIPKHQKFKIYIAPQAQLNIDDHSPLNITDLRLIRRLVRDMKFRNSSAAETIDMWQSVRSGEFKWIYPNQEGANFVFNSSLLYELCVLRSRALPALKEIPPTAPQFIIANRLIKYLKYFAPLEDESIIPCNSLIREFIGGSCFKV